MPGFPDMNGDGRIHVVDMAGIVSADGSTIHLWLINARPLPDSQTSTIMDTSKVGGYAMIEVFMT